MKIVILTGAGISAESGLQTFRAEDGLWEGHRVEDVATPEAMTILAATGQLAPRVRGLVRMGERRWDLVLDRNQRILLPSENPVRALERLLALDQAQDILARDIRAVDLRLPQRPTLRLTTFALNEIRSAQGLSQLETDL